MSAEEMSRASLKIAFDGPAIHNGTMDVRDLAPALLAVGHLCEEANRVLNGNSIQATVLVRSDFQRGSFEINLDLVQSLLAQMKSFLVGEDATAAAALLTFIGAGSSGFIGLFALIKKLRGRRPDRVTILADGTVRLEVGEQVVITTKEAVELYRDLAVRRAAADAVKPLEKTGIESIRFGQKGQEPEVITKEDVLFFIAPSPDEEKIIEDERRAAYTIVSISFKEGNKWRLHDGQNGILVTIADEDFLKRVNENEITFAKGDILVCRVLMQQWRVADGLRTEYTVLEVIEHKSAARQLHLPFDAPEKEK